MAVQEALGKLGIPAFLDTEEIDAGDSFQERLVDALLGARVVVVFAEPEYFHRWYCLLEFRVARTPFLRAIQSNAARREREAALSPLVIALPEAGSPLDDLDRFPALVKATSWPTVAEPAAVADLVRVRLEKSRRTIGGLLDSLPGPQGAQHFREMLLDADRLPPPLQLNTMPAVRPPEGSIHDAFVGRADDLWRIHDALTTHWGDVATAAGLTGRWRGAAGSARRAWRWSTSSASGPGTTRAGCSGSTRSWTRSRSSTRSSAGWIRARPRSSRPSAMPGATSPGAWTSCSGGSRTTGRRWWWWTTCRSRPGAVVPLRVDVLDVDAAVALLTRGDVDRDALSSDDWRRIAGWVGRLPLALELLNGLLAHGGTTPAALLHLTGGGSTTEALDAAMDALRGSVPAGALRGISEALSESYRRLSPQAQVAARTLAFLAPDPIPEELIEAMGSIFPPDVRIALVDRSFVTRAPGGAVAMFGSMHRVLADFLRTTAEDQEDELRAIGATLLDVFTPDRCRAPRHWSQMNALLPHVESVFERLLMDDRDETGAGIALRLAWHQDILADAQGQYARAKIVGKVAVETSTRVLGEEHPDTLTSMNNLAATYRSQGDLAGARAL